MYDEMDTDASLLDLHEGEDYDYAPRRADGEEIDFLQSKVDSATVPESAATPTARRSYGDIFKEIYPNSAPKPNDAQPISDGKNSTYPQPSLKYLECWFWHSKGQCKFGESVCKYSHRPTGKVAGPPSHMEPGRPAVAGANARSGNPTLTHWRNNYRPQQLSQLQPTEDMQSVNNGIPDQTMQFASPTKPTHTIKPDQSMQQVSNVQQAENMQQSQNSQPIHNIHSAQGMHHGSSAHNAQFSPLGQNFQQTRGLHPGQSLYPNQKMQFGKSAHTAQLSSSMQNSLNPKNNPQSVLLAATASTFLTPPQGQNAALAEHFKGLKSHLETVTESHYNEIQELLNMQLCDTTLSACPLSWRLELVMNMTDVTKIYRDMVTRIVLQLDTLEGRRIVAASHEPMVRQGHDNGWKLQ